MKQYIFGTLLGLLLCLPVLAQDISADAQLEPSEILIGDEVRLTIRLSYGPNLKLAGINLGILDNIDSIEIKNISNVDTASRAPLMNVQQVITLTSFDEGIYAIPPIPITFSQQGEILNAQTPALQLKVNTIPVNPTDSVSLQPIKDIIKEPLKIQDFLPYIAIGLGLLAVGLIIRYFLRRDKTSDIQIQATAPKLKPHELAMQRINGLKEENLLAKAAFKAFQTQISYILREYLENRYQIVALEATTYDLSKKLPSIDLPDNWRDELKKILQNADLVKFAKAEYPNDFHEKSLEDLIQFVEDSTPPEPPEDSEAEDQ
jgi:hypothetical protein